MHRRTVLLLTFCLAASGCGHKAWMESQVDPNYQPSRGDALFVTLPRQPSIQERQLLPILTTQLCADGFNLVPSIEQSKWTLGFSFARQTYEFGSTFSASTIPGSGVVIGSSRPNIVTDSTVRLYLFRSADFAGSAKPLSIWEGYISATNQVYQAYRPIIFKNLLDVYGQNVERTTRLRKEDLGTSPMLRADSSGFKGRPCGMGTPEPGR